MKIKQRRLLIIISILWISTVGAKNPFFTEIKEETADSLDPRLKSVLSRRKITPSKDYHPPILHSTEWNQPVPLESPISTAGAEDAGFIMPDGKTLYFWFTPDPKIPPNKQLFDSVTGIYVSKKINGVWSLPERIVLQEEGKLALDGCPFVKDDKMWFCSAREGYKGIQWFTAELKDGKWGNWEYIGDQFPENFELGELHISKDGQHMYYHSSRYGGLGQYDIWETSNQDGYWQTPRNIRTINSREQDGWPFVTNDGKELWFTRTYKGTPSIFRSKKSGGEWQEPELILSQFAGECSLDDKGNIYFSHHYFKDSKMIESDIYIAEKKN